MAQRLLQRNYDNGHRLNLAGDSNFMGGAAIPAIGSTSFSMEAWFFMPPGVSMNGILALNIPVGVHGLIIYGDNVVDQPHINVRLQSGAGASNITTVSNLFEGYIGKWIHFVITVDASDSKFRIYRNGVLFYTSAVVAWNLVNTYVAYVSAIGGFSNGTAHQCTNDFRIYSGTALTLAQVQSRYFDNKLISTNLVGHWLLTEGAGTAAADSSGNARTLTLSSALDWSTNSPMKARVLSTGALL